MRPRAAAPSQWLPKAAERREAFEEYNRRLVEESQQIIMVTEETSKRKNYYVNERGRMQVNAPWETCDYYRMTSYPDREAIVFE